MSPVFSPDGSNVAYTIISSEFDWDTWRVPVLGGDPAPWLPNASGLAWIDRQRLVFSEIKSGIHMAIVQAGLTRADSRDVYLPAHERGMAHRSYASPDGTMLLLAEMDGSGTWTPCRLVPLDGSSVGRQVGPPGGCTFGAWSPDGQWIYLSSNAGGAYHLWRQRVPDGEPEQLTFGPTEEEGIAVAPDGRSIVTAVGLAQRPILLRSGQSEREISLRRLRLQSEVHAGRHEAPVPGRQEWRRARFGKRPLDRGRRLRTPRAAVRRHCERWCQQLGLGRLLRRLAGRQTHRPDLE